MAVYKRNNSWYCRGQINSERYDCKCDGATNESEAKAIDDGIRYKIRLRQNGLEKEKEKVYAFSFLMERYVEVSSANNKSDRLAKIHSKYLIEYFGSKTNIKTIKPSDIEKFKLYMMQNGKANATINRYLSAIKRAYNILCHDNLISYNPTKNVKKLVEDNRRNRYLSKQEWEQLRVHLSDILLEIILTALCTGLRKGNVLNLHFDQIDMNARIITIKELDNKGKKIIQKPINEVLYDILLRKENKEGYVFVNPDTNLPYKDIRKSFNTALEKAGIKDFHFHDLRRTVGTWLLEEGVNIRTIQDLLDHSDISVTERYLSLTSEQNIRAMNILNDIVK